MDLIIPSAQYGAEFGSRKVVMTSKSCHARYECPRAMISRLRGISARGRSMLSFRPITLTSLPFQSFKTATQRRYAQLSSMEPRKFNSTVLLTISPATPSSHTNSAYNKIFIEYRPILVFKRMRILRLPYKNLMLLMEPSLG